MKPAYKDALRWIDGQKDAMVERLLAWSAINSGSGNLPGLRKMGRVVAEAFAVLGAEQGIIDPEPGEEVAADGSLQPVHFGPVHVFSKRPEANRRVLLTGHMDTVFGPDHAFQTPRFLDENTINGPGAADMKGGLLVMLTALRALERSGLGGALGYDVIVNGDEEIGSEGSNPVLVETARAADFGMTFEPALADGTLAGQRKGSGNFVIVVRGAAAHSGRDFEAGRNAVVRLAAIITELHALNGTIGGLTVNPAIIEGGTATNIVPDLAICRLNVRMDTMAEQDELLAALNEITARHDRTEGFSVELHGSFSRPPKQLSPANRKLFEVLKGIGAELDIEVKWRATGGCCDGNNLAAAGLANIDTLGVRGGLIHSAGEFALIDSFTERAKLSALMLMKYAAQEFEIENQEAREKC